MDRTFVLYFVVPVALGAGILLAGAILLMVASLRRRRSGEVDVDDWETAGGKVLSAKVKKRKAAQGESDSSYEPIVEYVYVVGDVERRGNKVFFGGGEKMSQADAEAILEKYPANSYVPVRYNPDNHAESALMSHPERPSYVLMGGYLFTSFGIAVCCFTSFMFVIILGGVR